MCSANMYVVNSKYTRSMKKRWRIEFDVCMTKESEPAQDVMEVEVQQLESPASSGTW